MRFSKIAKVLSHLSWNKIIDSPLSIPFLTLLYSFIESFVTVSKDRIPQPIDFRFNFFRAIFIFGLVIPNGGLRI